MEHKIARITVVGNEETPKTMLEKFYNEHRGKGNSAEFLVTPGGFLPFELPEKYRTMRLKEVTEDDKNEIIKLAKAKIIEFMKDFENKALVELVKFLVIGIDGFVDSCKKRTNNPIKNKTHKDKTKSAVGLNVQLIIVFDLKEWKIVDLTGKSYPTYNEQAKVITCYPMNSHILSNETFNGTVAALGCHDLYAFTENSRREPALGGKREEWRNEYRELLAEHKTTELTVLHLPHITNTLVWQKPWEGLCSRCENKVIYASGIKFTNPNNLNGKQLENQIKRIQNSTKSSGVSDVWEVEL